MTQFLKDMPIDDYHDRKDVVSKSMLKDFADCPARYKHKYIDGGEQKKSASLRMGNAVHVLALEPELWKSGYHVLPTSYYNDKGQKQGFRNDIRMQVVQDEYIAAGYEIQEVDGKKQAVPNSKSKIILTRSEYETIERMANALSKNYFACSLLKESGFVESSIFFDHEFTDPDTGESVSVPMRCRPDHMANNGVISDLKITKNAQPDLFYKDSWYYLYHLSVAITWLGYEAHFGKPPEEYIFITVEPDEPHIVECYGSLDPIEDLLGMTYKDFGTHHLNQIMSRFVKCQKENVWPSYQTKIGGMSVPSWVARKFITEGGF